MSEFWLPYTVVAVTSKSVEFPPSLLTEGDGTQGWLTDLPTARCTLYVDLGDKYDVGELALTGVQATHFELRGSSHPLSLAGGDGPAHSLSTLDAAKIAAATIAIDRTKLTDERTLVPRSELQSMFVHKKETSNQTFGSHLVANGDSPVPAAIPTQKIPVDPLCGRFVQTLILHFYCLWEPTTRVGIHSLAIRGKSSSGPAAVLVPSPSPVATMVKPVLSPTPPALTPEKVVKAVVVDKAPPLTAPAKLHDTEKATDLPPAKRKPVEATETFKPSPSPGTAPSQEKATPPLTVAETASGTQTGPSAPAAGSSLPFRHCVLVLSGYQNPLRSEIRDKALSIGAKVSNDWGTNCTHLICATAGTPKYVEVSKSGHGVVVSADWVLESWKGKKRQRESDYFIGDGGPDADSYGKGKAAAGGGGGAGGGWSSVL